METKSLNRKKTIELILNSIALLIFIWFVYQAYYELFVSIPRVHYPRVSLTSNDFGVISVDFALNVPTVAAFINLFAGFICICSSMAIYIIKIKPKRTKIYWIIVIAGFIICFFSMIYAINDFFTTAFDGVG